jgi:hypothetical protein
MNRHARLLVTMSHNQLVESNQNSKITYLDINLRNWHTSP